MSTKRVSMGERQRCSQVVLSALLPLIFAYINAESLVQLLLKVFQRWKVRQGLESMLVASNTGIGDQNVERASSRFGDSIRSSLHCLCIIDSRLDGRYILVASLCELFVCGFLVADDSEDLIVRLGGVVCNKGFSKAT